MSRYPAVLLMTLSLLAVVGCSRSPKEQLAYQHAEEQYQINQRSAERFRQGRAAAADEDVEPVRRSREDDE